MSKSVKSMRLSTGRRHSMSASQAAAQSSVMMPMMAGMPPMFPWLYPASQPSTSKGKKPWDSSSESESSGDFIKPPTKKRAKKAKPAAAGSAASSKAGRPTKARCRELEKIVDSYPRAYLQVDSVAHLESQECKACKIYVGRVALLPCGHAKFCFNCVNELKETAQTSRKPGRCLYSDCTSLVHKWIQLYHVHLD